MRKMRFAAAALALALAVFGQAQALDRKSLEDFNAIRSALPAAVFPDFLGADAPDAAAAPAEPGLKVQGDDQDVAVMRPILERLYQTMPKGIQATMDEGLVFVLSRDKMATELGAIGVAGWGPEDDPDYRFPDQKLFPEGTIKITLTPLTLYMAAFAESIPDPAAKAAVDTQLGVILIHEVTHVQQYRKAPLRGLQEGDRCAEDGDCDRKFFQDTIVKIHYEREAFAVDFAYEKNRRTPVKPLLDYLDKNPKALEGPFQASAKLIRRWISRERKVPMSEFQHAAYDAAFLPIVMARQYQAALGQLESELGKRDKSPSQIKAGVAWLKDLNDRYDRIMGQLKTRNLDPTVLQPYTKQVWPKLKERRAEAQGAIERAEAVLDGLSLGSAQDPAAGMAHGLLNPLPTMETARREVLNPGLPR